MSFAGIPPNPTVYVKNLNEKLTKTELKKNLYFLFSQFGNILDIHADKQKLRGQAWVIFESLAGATRALRELHEFAFFGKNMKLSYAKQKSTVIAQIDGTYVREEKPKKKGGDTAMVDTDAKPAEKSQPKPKKDTNAPASRSRNDPDAEPNKVLFVENLPEACSPMMLAILFQGYTGYKESRLVAGKPGIAFVEFTDPYLAGQAMESLQDFKMTPTNLIKISYAKQ